MTLHPKIGLSLPLRKMLFKSDKVPMFRLLLLITFAILCSADHATAYRPIPLQIHVSGEGTNTVSFTGWCDIEIGNRILSRTFFEGQNGDLAAITLHGRHIDNCEVTKTSEEGKISLVLHENSVEVFNKTTKKNETKIIYGPTMKRFSTKPPTMR